MARDITDEKILDRIKATSWVPCPMTSHAALSHQSFSELVADARPARSIDTQREFLDIAVRNSDRLCARSRPIGHEPHRIGPTRNEVRLVDLAAVLADVAATFRHEAYTKGLVFRDEVAELPLIRGDKARLIQVFCNLISNAIKYTPKGEIGIRATPLPDGVEVIVHDSGIGLTSEDQAHLFTSFPCTTLCWRREHRSGPGIARPLPPGGTID